MDLKACISICIVYACFVISLFDNVDIRFYLTISNLRTNIIQIKQSLVLCRGDFVSRTRPHYGLNFNVSDAIKIRIQVSLPTLIITTSCA